MCSMTPTPLARPATPRYVVFFDGHCRLCTEGHQALGQMETTADLRFVDVQDWSQLSQYPQIDPAAALGQMHVLTPDGTVAGGFDALVALMPALPDYAMFHPLLRRPLVRRVGHKVYKWVARHRYSIGGTMGGCAGGACKIG
jgi:predicted DCC family thiol-disulfide oxidoreductase YuxK